MEEQPSEKLGGFLFYNLEGGGGVGGLLNGCCILSNFVPGDLSTGVKKTKQTAPLPPEKTSKPPKTFRYHSFKSIPPLIIIPSKKSNSGNFLSVTGIARCFMNGLQVTAHMGLKDGLLLIMTRFL